MKIGLFFGSDTGNTEDVAEQIAKKIGEDNIEVMSIGDASPGDFEDFDKLILGLSTWYDGELQSEWEDFFEELDNIDFTGKTVAIFGLGDQLTYGEYFVDAIGLLYDKVIERGATVVGEWPTDGYDYDESVAERDGKFVGLPLDEDNESDLTEERIDKWLNQISGDLGFSL